ncbi:MAG: ACT domain-containing protein [Thermodesulfobacteriota bacterium]
MSDTVNKYYIRFQAEDRPGVLGKITGGLGANGISIESVIQREGTTAAATFPSS